MKHIFAVCAYGQSPYLRECLESLRQQETASAVILCTATPSVFLSRMAEQFDIPLFVNDAKPDIAGDWNFAMLQAKRLGADAVTLCHQDDVYMRNYGASLHAWAIRRPDWLIYFTDYGEKRGDRIVTDNRNLRIKRLLLWRMRIPFLQASRHAKRRTLALGDPICCPSVTFHLNRISLPLFETGMTTNLDWQTWEKLANQPGRFLFDPRVLMAHRIHAESTTSKVLGQGGRTAQDLAMFRRFWPAPIAKLLTRVYAKSEDSNWEK